jgi:hypothetical protein
MFAAYPTAALAAADELELAAPYAPGRAAELMAQPSVLNAGARLPGVAEVEALFASLANGPKSVAQLMEETPPERRPFVERSLLWLLKFDFLRLRDRSPRN